MTICFQSRAATVGRQGLLPGRGVLAVIPGAAGRRRRRNRCRGRRHERRMRAADENQPAQHDRRQQETRPRFSHASPFRHSSIFVGSRPAFHGKPRSRKSRGRWTLQVMRKCVNGGISGRGAVCVGSPSDDDSRVRGARFCRKSDRKNLIPDSKERRRLFACFPISATATFDAIFAPKSGSLSNY